jgi:peptide-methionine (S)-S-oxide reductase
MTSKLIKIAVGGGCHWCTEAVFQSLIGVKQVEQGYVASDGDAASFSEAVIVHFNPETLPLSVLINIHLHTHKSTANHSFRDKYRSAVYFFSEIQHTELRAILKQLQSEFKKPLVTKTIPFTTFKPSREQITEYYYKNPQKPFCKQFIHPKLTVLLRKFSEFAAIDLITKSLQK